MSPGSSDRLHLHHKSQQFFYVLIGKDEVTRVLREKFDWPEYDVQDAYQRMKKICRIVEPNETVNIIAYDPPDNRILECAKAVNVDRGING